MTVVATVEFFQVVLAIHILAVVIGFGVTFAYPIMFAAARRADPAVLPWLYRTMQRFGRFLVNPGLLVVVLAGVYLASHLHQWKLFYVQWGIGAAIVIGAVEGAFMIPRGGPLGEGCRPRPDRRGRRRRHLERRVQLDLPAALAGRRDPEPDRDRDRVHDGRPHRVLTLPSAGIA